MSILRFGVLAAVALLTAAPTADAITISREGSEIVVRPDPGEPLRKLDVMANADRDSFAVHNLDKAADHVASHAGPGCDAGGASCNIAGATALRVELGAGHQHLLVQGSPIPVIVDGGAGNDHVIIRGGPTITVAGGGGDDVITMRAWAPPGGTEVGGTDEAIINPPTTSAVADGGPGDDQLASFIRGARMTGGAGNDVLDATARTPTAQQLTCGSGRDVAMVDHRDTLGAGCGPGVRGLRGDSRRNNTLGWFGRDGNLSVRSFLRAARGATARLTVKGPRLAGRRTYASAQHHVRAGAAVRATLRPAAGVRSTLSRRKAKISRSSLEVSLSAHGDRTVVTLFGSFKRR